MAEATKRASRAERATEAGVGRTPAAKAKKSSARTPAAKSKAPATKAEPKKRKPVTTLGGQEAKTRHFLVDRELHAKASERVAQFEGLVLSDVMRHGIDLYAKEAPSRPVEETLLPASALESLAALKGDSARLTEYTAALARAGWTYQAIANSMVAAGLAAKMSRQAVSLRVKRAPEKLRRGLPKVPKPSARRLVPRNESEAMHRETRSKDTLYNTSFRVADESYLAAKARCKAEGSMVTVVIEDTLKAFLAGKYDKALGLK